MRKRCRRKIWSTQIDPVAHAIAGAALTTPNVLKDLRTRDYLALDAIVTGLGGVNDWKTLTDTLNVCEYMASKGVGPEALPACQAAEKALIAAAERYAKTGKMGFDGPGIQAIREMIEYADAQQSSISRSEFERFIERTRNYIQSKGDKVREIE